MNSLIILIAALVFYFAAYRIYAVRIARLFGVSPERKTPAYTKFDSVDYVPARNWLVLFGHHFASIAGAGPVIGPVIAVVMWGWLPALLWVAFGTVFIGGVHDFGSLIVSVKEGGSSVADVSRDAVSRRAKLLFSVFVLMALILVVAVFAVLCAKTFIFEPKVVLPSAGLIPVAAGMGYFMYRRRFNIAAVTLSGLLLLSGLIFLGGLFPVAGSLNFWMVLLFIYAYAASVLPVDVLLQPRDYLAGFMLFIGIALGCAGLLISQPQVTVPAFTGRSAEQGHIWPMLFVIVACGAISGFHSLVASGTTSKQLATERDALRVGYGAMVAEGIVAVVAVIAAAVIFKPGDNPALLLKEKTPIGIFAEGYGSFTASFLGPYGAFIAMTILNAFIFTTLDSATRICRYVFEELFHVSNRYLSTLIIVGLSAALAFSNQWHKIWPVFGASNQLVAALALLVMSCWLLARGRIVWYTLIPALFMLVTTLAALGFLVVQSAGKRDFVLVTACGVLMALAVFMVCETVPLILSSKKNKKT